jgi:hypothetical protein
MLGSSPSGVHSFFVFGMRSYYVVQADPKLAIFLPQSPKC